MIVVAEAGSNWIPGEIDSAFALIEAAAEVGADAVKFQDWRVDSIDRPEEWKERCRSWELPAEWIEELYNKAGFSGLNFCTSVYDDYAVVRTTSNAPRQNFAIKVGSSECFNFPLLQSINRQQWYPQVWLSVPHRLPQRISLALSYLNHCRVTILACADSYPTSRAMAKAYLPRLGWFRETFGLPVGWSSHVAYPDATEIAAEAARLGASVVEVHIKLPSTPEECPDSGPWSLLPEEFAELVAKVREAGESDGLSNA